MKKNNFPKKAKILLVLALFIEAKPFIEKLRLWEKDKYLNFQIFYNDDFVILITWTWKVSISSWVTYVFITFPEIYYVLNIWISWSINWKIWDIFLINKIIDNDSGQAFYPDFLFETDLKSTSLTTVSKIWNWKWEISLIDMEWSAFFEISSKFLKVDSIALIKIVSDNTDIIKLDKQLVDDVLKKSVTEIYKFIEKIPIKKVDESFYKKKEISLFASKNWFSITQSRMLVSLVWSLHIQTEKSVNSFLKWIRPKNKKQISDILIKLKEELEIY